MAEATLRLFVAAEIPANVRDALGELAGSLRKQVRGGIAWVAPDSLHLTLRFLGDTPRSLVPALSARLEEAVGSIDPFTLAASGTGVFPNDRDPRVIWAGLSGDMDALKALRQAVEGGMRAAGMAADERPFRAHLTLGRARQRLAREQTLALQAALAAVELAGSVPFGVSEAVLFKSELRPGVARHTRLHVAPLGR